MRKMTKQQAEDAKQSHANVGEGNKVMFLEIMCATLERSSTEGLSERVCKMRDAMLKAYDMAVDNNTQLAGLVFESSLEEEK